MIAVYFAVSIAFQYFFPGKNTNEKIYGEVLRITKNNELIAQKPIEISLSSLEDKKNTAFTITEKKSTTDQQLSIQNSSVRFEFSSFTGTPIFVEYTHPITQAHTSIYSFDVPLISEEGDHRSIPPLFLVINKKGITDYQIETKDEQTIIFTKKHYGIIIKRIYTIEQNGLNCRLEIENPNNLVIGLIQIITEDHLLQTLDTIDNGFNYHQKEKLIKIHPSNQLVVEESVILNPEVVGMQGKFFTTAVVSSSFEKGYFHLSPTKKLQFYLDHQAKNQETVTLSMKFFCGPKIGQWLEKIDSRLTAIMEYGILHKVSSLFIACILWLTSLFGNLGLALIIFMIIMKLATIPFLPYLNESNKKNKEFMQKQEYINAKYHNNPEKKAAEQMALFQEYGFFGGVLAKIPQILTVLIIFSLQGVLRNNILLTGVPVGLWLTDASMSDKYYILPVLLFIFTYLNLNQSTKITPMMKITILLVMVIILYVFSFWSSGIQFFVVLTTLASFLENKYLLNK